MRLSLERNALPAGDSGLTADATSGRAFSDFTVAPTALEYFASVSFAPAGACMTTGFVPLAWTGHRLFSRAVALWDPVPGSFRLWLVSEPTCLATSTRATATAAQTPRTT